MNDPQRQLSSVLEWLQSDAAGAALAGAAGGLVRWLTLRESLREGVGSLTVGALCAVYLGPMAEPMLAPVIGALPLDASPEGFSSFLVGVGGIGLVGLIMETLRAWKRPGTDGGSDAR